METAYPYQKVGSLEDFIKYVSLYAEMWGGSRGLIRPWFRGQPNQGDDPIPKIFRPYTKGGLLRYSLNDEFWMVTSFRNKAPSIEVTPETDRLDKWLFLMQHHGLPTRLLDWTESSLIALYFAVRGPSDADAGLWMLHPIKLNVMTTWGQSVAEREEIFVVDNYPNTWATGKVGSANFEYCFNGISVEQIIYGKKQKGNTWYRFNAEGKDQVFITTFPLAIQPSYIHRRMIAQRSVFTIHGALEKGFEAIFSEGGPKTMDFLRKIVIPNAARRAILSQLRTSGFVPTALFPDLDRLSEEVAGDFRAE